MSAAFAWKKLIQLGPIHWNRVAPWRAGRVALGVVLPLGIGWMNGHVEYGAFMALGALPAGLASFQGETRSRVGAVLLASVGMAVSTFVGASTAAAAPWMLVPIVAFWGYITGLSICLGPRVSVAILTWSIALLIAVGLPATAAEAALHAGLVLGGGALQAALVAVSWTLRPGTTERNALAASYRAVAAYASNLAAGVSGAPPSTVFPAGSVLDDPNPLLPRNLRLAFINLLEEAERMRASLAALAAQAADLPKSNAPEIRAFVANAATALGLVGRALDSPRAERDTLERDLSAHIAALKVPADVVWCWSGEALLGQLRAVGRLIAYIGGSTRHTAGDAGAARVPIRNEGLLAWGVATLRANVTTKTEAGRHALRLAAITALSEAIVQGTGLYLGRWTTLTIFLVLKPDYSSTFSLAPQLALGTVVGAAFGAGAAQLTDVGLIAAAGVSVAAAYAFFDVNYLLFGTFLTTFILIMLELLGLPALPTAEARIFDTFIGAGLALAAYYLWPTWQGVTAQEKFARFIEAHRDYGTGLLRELAHPGTLKPAELRALQAAARQARSDAEAATARLADEPEQPQLRSNFAQLLLATATRLARVELALHALAVSKHWARASPKASAEVTMHLDALRAGFDTAMSRIAAALRSLREHEPIPRLRATYPALPPTGDAPLAALVDSLIDAIDTLDEIVRDRI
jgi:uncharacterized membrane protein YccC